MKIIKYPLSFIIMAITFVPLLAAYCVMQAFNERRHRKGNLELNDTQLEYLKKDAGRYHGVGRTGRIEQEQCKTLGHDMVGTGHSMHVWCKRCDKFLGLLKPGRAVLM